MNFLKIISTVVALYLSVFQTLSCYGQDDTLCSNNILTTRVYRKGFYSSVEDFKSNQPAITNRPVKIIRQDATVKGSGWYNIELVVPPGNPKAFYKEIWGYCSGDAIYICDGRILNNGEKTFSKLVILGNLSLLECHDPKAIAYSTYELKEVAGAMVADGMTYIPHGIASKSVYMLDLINNDLKPFNAFTLGEVLYLHDKILFEEFRTKTAVEKDAAVIDYVYKYNSKRAK